MRTREKMPRVGLAQGTDEWLAAMRAYYQGDEDVVALCDALREAWDLVDTLQGESNGREAGSETASRCEDDGLHDRGVGDDTGT
jgi:hypothetical protein